MSASESTEQKCGTPLSVVYIHGFLDNQEVWLPVRELLGSRKYDHHALDLRGAGALRTSGGPYTLVQAVADVLELLDLHHMARVVLVGHSMGSQIAELVAAKVPERVAALALLTPVSLAGSDLPPEVVSFLRTSGGDAEAQRAIRRQFSRNLPEPEIERLVREDVLMDVAAVEAYFDAFTKGDTLGDSPSTYVGPVLILGAREDPVVNINEVATMADARFPAARLVSIANSGHWPQLEQPSDTASALADFLTNRIQTDSRAGE